MNNSLNNLAPKANKLLSNITNWKFSKEEKNIELGLAIEELIEKGSFPQPIRTFFKIPSFQKLLTNLKEGVLSQKPSSGEEELEFYPPMEIQKLQHLAESFHKLVHLDYDKMAVKDPFVQSKVLSANILDYLSCIELFIQYEGKLVSDILNFLFKAVQSFANRLQETILKTPHVFSHEILDLIDLPVFDTLKNLNKTTYHHHLIEDWYPIEIEFNIDPKLSILHQDLEKITHANAHKLINQIQTILQKKSAFYQRNIPLYVPRDIRKKAEEFLNQKESNEEIQGQKINEFFMNEFWKEKYEVIEARQNGINEKFRSMAHQIWPIKESIYTLIQQYGSFLPECVSTHLIETLRPLSLILSILGKPNHLAVQFVTGFYSTQYDYLHEIIDAPEPSSLDRSLKKKIDKLTPILMSFAEMYYHLKPKASYKTIKHYLENLYQGKHALKNYPIKEIKTHLSEAFSLLIPQDNLHIEKLEALFFKLLMSLRDILDHLDPCTIEHTLLEEKLTYFEKTDLPSFSQTWYGFGEIIGVLFVLYSGLEELFHNKMHTLFQKFQKEPFIQLLFFDQEF